MSESFEYRSTNVTAAPEASTALYADVINHSRESPSAPEPANPRSDNIVEDGAQLLFSAASALGITKFRYLSIFTGLADNGIVQKLKSGLSGSDEEPHPHLVTAELPLGSDGTPVVQVSNYLKATTPEFLKPTLGHDAPIRALSLELQGAIAPGAVVPAEHKTLGTAPAANTATNIERLLTKQL